MTQHAPDFAPATQKAGVALAIVALVLAIIGQCLIVIGPLIALVLGIVALVGTRDKQDASAPKTISIIAITLASVGLLMTPLLVGIMLPAVQSAREAARKVVSQRNARGLARGVDAWQTAQGRPIDPSTWRRTLDSSGTVTRDMFVSPHAPSGFMSSYFIVPAGTIDRSTGFPTNLLIYEHPDLHEDGSAVAYVDGHAEWLDQATLQALLMRLETPFGAAWAPHERVDVPE